MDADGDGSVSQNEMEGFYLMYDSNEDGEIDEYEMKVATGSN